MHARIYIGVCLLLAFAARVEAQSRLYPPHGPQQQQQPRPISVDGTIVSVGNSQLQINTNTNAPVLVGMNQSTTVKINGTAEASYLKAGLAIEFAADLDKIGAAKDKVSELTIVTITQDEPAGLLPETAASHKHGDKAGADPGIANPGAGQPKGNGHGKKSDDDASGLFGAQPAKAKATTAKLPGTYTVRGTIKTIHGDKVTVAAGRGPTIKFELADSPQIDVNGSDLRLTQAGDKISVKGLGMGPRIMAETIKIDLANQLSGPKKRTKAAAQTEKTVAKHSAVATKADPTEPTTPDDSKK